MVLTLTFPSPTFCVKDATVMALALALALALRWYDERPIIHIYIRLRLTFADMGTDG